MSLRSPNENNKIGKNKRIFSDIPTQSLCQAAEQKRIHRANTDFWRSLLVASPHRSLHARVRSVLKRGPESAEKIGEKDDRYCCGCGAGDKRQRAGVINAFH